MRLTPKPTIPLKNIFFVSLIGTLQIGYLDLGTKDDDDDNDDGNSGKSAPPAYLTTEAESKKQQDVFAVPAPVVTKTKAKRISNVLPPINKNNDTTDDIEEDYQEPWEK